MIRFSLRLNNDLPIKQYVALAQAAEAAGFHQFWVSNDLFLRSNLVILPAVAQATTRIEIGTGILNPYTTHPAEMAMFAATMDELSGNRFNLGIAAGAGSFLDWIGLEQFTAVYERLALLWELAVGALGAMPGGWRENTQRRLAALTAL